MATKTGLVTDSDVSTLFSRLSEEYGSAKGLTPGARTKITVGVNGILSKVILGAIARANADDGTFVVDAEDVDFSCCWRFVV